MTIKEFVKSVSDHAGPVQSVAAEEMERMTKMDFYELMNDMESARNRGVILGIAIACLVVVGYGITHMIH